MERTRADNSKIERKMVAKISSGSSVYGVLNYNQIKVDKKEAEVLYSQKMFVSPDGNVSLQDCIDSFYPYLAMNQRTKNVVFHASINPDPKDNISDEKLSTLCQEYMEQMGYGNQPYVVYLHQDINRKHAHIVSLRIDERGKKLSDKFENKKSMGVCRALETAHKLRIPTKLERTQEPPTKKIDYKKGDIKHQIGNITKSVIQNYNFQSFGEYRTLLEIFNITAEEVKSKDYQGVIYSATDENGSKIGVPIKSSKFGKSVGYAAIQKQFEKSKIEIEKSNIKDRLKPIISSEMRKAKSIDSFKKSLLQQDIGCITRQNQDGRIYGVSFIDYQNKTILNGSRLGKEFSASLFNDIFKKSFESSTPKVSHSEIKTTNQVPDYQQFDNASNISLFAFEQHGTDWESENFAREKENEEKARQRKRRYRRL